MTHSKNEKPRRDGYQEADFHLFVSYTRTPDAALAQEVERFLESFHTVRPPGGSELLPPLRVCVDGSDFSMPPMAEREGRVREILEVVYTHLARARELLVLCSSGAAQSEWVDKEIRWFLEHRGANRIRIAFTEGVAPHNEEKRYFPPVVLEHGLLKGLAYDLRGYDKRRARDWHQVADFSREMVRLAADLHGRSAGDLYPTWLEAELERARRQSTTMASNARFETFAGNPARAVLAAYQANQLYPSEAGEAALRDAYRVAMLHYHNRRQIAQITGSGPSYLADRWKQGDVFTKTSANGRFRLLVTERGRDGPHPPGDVFLLNNETLRAVELAAHDKKYRVEEAAFDRAIERVFVTRYFDLYVHGLDGGLLGEYAFSSHTKSPIHLLDGLFQDRWILGAESKGGVWLVDPDAKRQTITVHGELYGDATVMTDISPDRRRLTVVYESGKANLLELDSAGKPRLRPLAGAGALYAGFPTRRNDQVVLTGRDGTLRTIEIDADETRELLRAEPVGTDVDWVSWDPETNRLALVGGDRAIHIADAETGLRIATLDYADAIDWRDAISMAVPHTFVEPGPAWEAGKGEPFPSDALAVSAIERTGSQTWIVTEEWPSEYWPTHRVHLVENGRAYFLAEGGAPVNDHDGVLVPAGARQVYVRVATDLRPFPPNGDSVSCVLAASDGLWIGTRAGAFRRQGDRFERMTPPSVSVQGLAELDGTIWMRGKTGAYAYAGSKLMRITDPFLSVSSVQKVGCRVWILGEPEGAGAGPAWRVDRWLTSAVPDREARVSRLFETPDAVWLVDRTRLHRARGEALDAVETELEVSALRQVGGSIWCTTKRPGLLGGVGPLLRIDASTLELQAFELIAPVIVSVGEAAFVTHVVDPQWKLFETPMGRRGIARLGGRAPQPIELGDAGVQRVVGHRGTVWLLTSTGAFVVKGNQVEEIGVPALSYTGLVWLGGSTWLYATTAAVRLRGAEATVFETAQPVREVVRVRGSTWLLTGDETGGAGPAYRVRGPKAIAHSPGGAGIAAVVDFDGGTWLLTRRGNRAGPMVRAAG